MKKLVFAFIALLFTVQAQAAYLVMSPNGSYTQKATLTELLTDPDTAGKHLVLTTPGASLTTAIALAGGRTFECKDGGYITLSGSGALTGLPEADIRWFGGKGDGGTTDNGPALTNAINSVVSGGTVIVPPSSDTYAIKTQVKITDKFFILQVNGTLADQLTSFTYNDPWTSLALDNKGVIAISGGSVSIVGRAGATTFYGGDGVAGVDQDVRTFIYVYNAVGVFFKEVRTDNLLGAGIQTFSCTNVRDIDGFYNDGEYTVVHSRVTDLVVRGGRFLDNKYGGLTVLDRGGFIVDLPGGCTTNCTDSSVLPFKRPSRIAISDNIITGTYADANHAAVGLTVDSSDDLDVTNNFVDGVRTGGTNTMTMGTSFAGINIGTVTGNTVKNITNTGNGTATYSGIGMEIDLVNDVSFTGNSFADVLMPYLVVNSQNVELNGTSVANDAAGRESIISTGAGSAAFVNFANSTVSTNISVSGVTDGGSYVLYAGANAVVRGLHVHNLYSMDYYSRWFFAASGAVLYDVDISNCSVYEPDVAKEVMVFTAGTLYEITVKGFKAIATDAAPGTGMNFFVADKSGAHYVFSGLDITNYDGIMGTVSGNAAYYMVSDYRVNSVEASNAAAMMNPGGGTEAIITNGIINGVAVEDRGTGAKIITGDGAPGALAAKFTGQVYIDYTNKVGYVATNTGSGTDWLKTTP